MIPKVARHVHIALVGAAMLCWGAGAAASGTPVTLCMTLPKAQLGQGNDTMKDVSEPVRVALGKFMAGPAVQLVRLDARIPVQIESEAQEKGCTYVLQTTVEQKKGGSASGLLKTLAPLASAALPMLAGGAGDYAGAMAAQAAGQAMSTVAAESAAEDYASAMQGAQQGGVKKGDTVTVSYVLTRVGSPTPVKQDSVKQKADEDGEDLLSPLLEKVATDVVTVATSSG